MKREVTAKGLATLIVLIVLSVLLLVVLAFNVTLIIKGSLNPDLPPNVFGIAPLPVETPSMTGENPDSFSEGALIFVRILSDEDKQQLQVGDIVTYRSGEVFVTHRVVQLHTENGVLTAVTTKGDANSGDDGAVALSNVIGKCVASVEKLGSFAMFLQTPVGILVFVGIPVVAFIVYDIVRIQLYNRKTAAQEQADQQLQKTQEELQEKEKELARLRALVQEQDQPAENETGGNSDN